MREALSFTATKPSASETRDEFTRIHWDIDDHRPVPKLAHQVFGKLFADKGYISQFASLLKQH